MKTFFYGLCLFALGSLTAQVGINTTNPHPSAALDIKPDVFKQSVGLLMPNLSTAQRNGLNKTLLANSLLVYDTDLNMYMYFDKASNNWYALNALATTIVDKNGGKDTVSKHAGKMVLSTQNANDYALEVNGNIKLNGKVDGDITATSLHGEGAVPVGSILMWSGNPTTLPKGWALCNGDSGRPDLRSRFVVGYDPRDVDYSSVGKVGPVYEDADVKLFDVKDSTILTPYYKDRVVSFLLSGNTNILTPSNGYQMVAAKHIPGEETSTYFINFQGEKYDANDSVYISKESIVQVKNNNLITQSLTAKKIKLKVEQMPSHNHTGTTAAAGDHAHKQGSESLYSNYGGGNSVGNRTWVFPNSGGIAAYSDQSTSTNGSHIHQLNINTNGSSQAFENRPPYYVLAYIIKLKY